MRTKVFSAPKSIKPPVVNWEDMKAWDAENKRYIADVVAYAKGKNPDGKHTGAIVRFPVADGQAEYVVMNSGKKLIHLTHMDGYSYPDVAKYTDKEILAEVDKQTAFDKLFS